MRERAFRCPAGDCPLRLPQWSFAALPLLALLGAGTVRADIQIRIDDVKLDKGAKVQFSEVVSARVTVDPTHLKDMKVGETANHRFKVYVDLDSIEAKTSFVNYDFYARPTAAPEVAPLTRVSFQASPYDSFPDQEWPLEIHVLDNNVEDVVRMSIPIHSLKGDDFVTALKSSDVKIHVSGDTLKIELKNTLDLPVEIVGSTVAMGSKPYWNSTPSSDTAISLLNPLSLGVESSNRTATLSWDLKPNAWNVLKDSLIPLSKGKADETLKFTITYRVAHGGFRHSLELQRDLYFYPNLLYLMVVSALGALATTFVVFFGVQKNSCPRKFFWTSLINIVLASIVELIAIVLFSFDNSKIQIGVIDLNPTLLIPATCLGILSTVYGFKIVGKLVGEPVQNSTAPAPSRGD